MKIKRFLEFILEKFNPEESDSVILKSKKNLYNKREILIKKFNEDKNKLKFIYMTAINDEDLINKLFINKYILKKTNEPKEMDFVNPHLRKLAEIADNLRKSKDLEKIAKGNNDDLESYSKQISDADNSQSVIKSTETKIETTKKRLQDNKVSAKKIEMDSRRIDKKVGKEIEKLKEEQAETKKEISQEERNDKSNSADLASGDEESQSE